MGYLYATGTWAACLHCTSIMDGKEHRHGHFFSSPALGTAALNSFCHSSCKVHSARDVAFALVDG